MVNLKIIIVSPAYLLFISLLFLLLLFLVAPVDYNYTGSFLSWGFFFISVGSVFLGYFTANPELKIYRTIVVKTKISKINKLFWVVMFLVVTGFILQLVDIFLVRGAKLGNDFFENREMLQENSSGLISFIAAFLYPSFLALPFFYMLKRKFDSSSYSLLLIVLFILLSELFISVLFGSRVLVLIVVAMLYLYAHSLGFIKFDMKTFLLTPLLAFMLIYFSGVMFIERTALFGLDPLLSTQVSGYAYWIPLKEEAYLFIDGFRQNPIIFNFLIGLITLVQYFIHSLIELLYIVDNFEIQNIFFGGITFSIYLKALEFLGLSGTSNVEGILRVGVYRTLWGNLYYDFAYLGFVVSYLIGIFLGLISKIRSFSLILLMPLFLYLSLVVTLSPFMNLITNGKGIYFISAFLLIFFVFKFSELSLKK